MFSGYGKLNLYKSDRGEGGGGCTPPPAFGYTPEKINTVPQKTKEIQYIKMELLWFFVGKTVYSIILEIDYGWLIEVCFSISDCQQNTRNLKLIVLAGTVGVKKLEESMLKSYATSSHFFGPIC